ncbi:MAG: aminopeptidase P family N-terminal domain-containing protein [Sporomusa sp.]
MNNWNPSELKAGLSKYDREAIYKSKVTALQKTMIENDLKAMICFKPQNTFSLSGFSPVLYSHPVVVIVPAEGEAVLLVHSLRANHSKDEAAMKNIRLFGAWATQKPIADNAYDAISIILDELSVKRGNVGYEGDFLSVGQFEKIQTVSEAAKMIDVKDILLESRIIKTEYEIVLLKLESYMANIGNALRDDLPCHYDNPAAYMVLPWLAIRARVANDAALV